MSLPVLPPELHIQIIDHVGRPPPTRHLAFKLPPDTTQDLLSLSLVSRDYHVWTTGILYQRISLTPSQLGRLRATLCPKQTEKITRLAKWIKSLSIRWREEDHGGRTGRPRPGDRLPHRTGPHPSSRGGAGRTAPAGGRTVSGRSDDRSAPVSRVARRPGNGLR